MKPKNNKEFVKAKKWAIKNLTNTEVYVPLLKANLLFTKEGINHGLYYKQSAVKAKILHNIFDVLKQLKTIKKGVIKEKDREKIIAVHILTGFYNIGSTKYKTYVVVKEDENNNYYYDSGIVTKIKGS